MECSCGVCRTKMQRRLFKRPITAFLVLISQGPQFQDRIRRLGYYWPSMIKDCIDYARRCDARQFHGDYIHQALEPLHPTVPSWSFEAWGMDVIGSHQTSLSPLRCTISRCLPSFVAALSSALPRTDLLPQLLLPSLTALERNKLNLGTYLLALSLCSLLAVWELHSSPLSLDNPTFSFITVMLFHVSDDSAGGKRQGFDRSAEEGSGLELV